jgi:hypothetical protein
VSVTVDVSKTIFRVAPQFVSFNFDTSFYRSIHLGDKSLRLLASALAPAHLRVGGTQGDYDIYLMGDHADLSCSKLPPPMTDYRCKTVTTANFQSLVEFVEATNLTLVYGLNDMYGRPTKTKPEKKLCDDKSCPLRNQSNIADLLQVSVTVDPAVCPTLLWLLYVFLSGPSKTCRRQPSLSSASSSATS